MKDELERLIEDRDEAERDLEFLEDELHKLEIDLGPDCEDFPEWEDLFHEVNELNNHIAYLSACISSIEEGYED